jgi:ribosome assembly protein YihI (activator of Der GTPase)
MDSNPDSHAEASTQIHNNQQYKTRGGKSGSRTAARATTKVERASQSKDT